MERKGFVYYSFNELIFELLFKKKCNIEDVAELINIYLFHTYERNEIHKKAIKIIFYDTNKVVNVVFKDDDINQKSFFNINRKTAIERLENLKTFFDDSNDFVFTINDLEILTKPNRDLGTEFIGFRIYDNSKGRIKRYIKRIFKLIHN